MRKSVDLSKSLLERKYGRRMTKNMDVLNCVIDVLINNSINDSHFFKYRNIDDLTPYIQSLDKTWYIMKLGLDDLALLIRKNDLRIHLVGVSDSNVDRVKKVIYKGLIREKVIYVSGFLDEEMLIKI